MKVLVKEKIGDSGVELLRDAGLDVELGRGLGATASSSAGSPSSTAS